MKLRECVVCACLLCWSCGDGPDDADADADANADASDVDADSSGDAADGDVDSARDAHGDADADADADGDASEDAGEDAGEDADGDADGDDTGDADADGDADSDTLPTDCTELDDGDLCDDGDPCTLVDMCDNGQCEGGDPPEETCNLLDDDCDGEVDEGLLVERSTIRVSLEEHSGYVAFSGPISVHRLEGGYLVTWIERDETGPETFYASVVTALGDVVIREQVLTARDASWIQVESSGTDRFVLGHDRIGEVGALVHAYDPIEEEISLVASVEVGTATLGQGSHIEWAGDTFAFHGQGDMAFLDGEGVLEDPLVRSSLERAGTAEWTEQEYGVLYSDDADTILFRKRDATGAATTEPIVVSEDHGNMAVMWTGTEFLALWSESFRTRFYLSTISADGLTSSAPRLLTGGTATVLHRAQYDPVRQEVFFSGRAAESQAQLVGRIHVASGTVEMLQVMTGQVGQVLAADGEWIFAHGFGDMINLSRYGCSDEDLLGGS